MCWTKWRVLSLVSIKGIGTGIRWRSRGPNGRWLRTVCELRWRIYDLARCVAELLLVNTDTFYPSIMLLYGKSNRPKGRLLVQSTYSKDVSSIRAKTTAQGTTKLSEIMEYGSVSVLDELKSTE